MIRAILRPLLSPARSAMGAIVQSQQASVKLLADAALAQIDGTIHAGGIAAPVDVLRDRWGRTAHPRVSPRTCTSPGLRDGAGPAVTVAADGASYREIFDVANWNRSLVINTPGQSGQPGSRFGGNLLKGWADNKYFNLAFSKDAVEKVPSTV